MIPLSELWEVKILAVAVFIAIVFACIKVNNKIEKDQQDKDDDTYPDMNTVDEDIFS